ncbi:hypothetical protein C8Q79DRAFT_137802 [Trametes meyenii]|nr:hypothetical protein C8Q79DRAFT_137802 [Trametes meyenii]
MRNTRLDGRTRGMDVGRRRRVIEFEDDGFPERIAEHPPRSHTHRAARRRDALGLPATGALHVVCCVGQGGGAVSGSGRTGKLRRNQHHWPPPPPRPGMAPLFESALDALPGHSARLAGRGGHCSGGTRRRGQRLGSTPAGAPTGWRHDVRAFVDVGGGGGGACTCFPLRICVLPCPRPSRLRRVPPPPPEGIPVTVFPRTRPSQLGRRPPRTRWWSVVRRRAPQRWRLLEACRQQCTGSSCECVRTATSSRSVSVPESVLGTIHCPGGHRNSCSTCPLRVGVGVGVGVGARAGGYQTKGRGDHWRVWDC